MWSRALAPLQPGLTAIRLRQPAEPCARPPQNPAVIDTSAPLRRLLVSAIPLDYNVQVPTGKAAGGSFVDMPPASRPRKPGV